MRFSLLILAVPALAAVNEPCYGPEGVAGVCVANADCDSAGGTAIDGACPADPAGVRCCTKAPCLENGSTSQCGWVSDCAGSSSAGLCPGPSQMQCCDSTDNGWGGYPAPTIPAVGACQQTAVDGANAVVNQFPGAVREIFCIRDCACPGTSEHCCGMAIDYMIGNEGSVSIFRIPQIVCLSGVSFFANFCFCLGAYSVWYRDCRVGDEPGLRDQPLVCHLGPEDLVPWPRSRWTLVGLAHHGGPWRPDTESLVCFAPPSPN